MGARAARCDAVNRSSASGSVAEALRIEWSPRGRRQAHQQIAASLAPGQPRRAAQLHQLLAQRDLVAEFEQCFGGYGLRLDSLDDVTTAHWLTMWTVVHDAPFPDAALVRTVREQQGQCRSVGDAAGLAQMARSTTQSMRTKRGITPMPR